MHPYIPAYSIYTYCAYVLYIVTKLYMLHGNTVLTTFGEFWTRAFCSFSPIAPALRGGLKTHYLDEFATLTPDKLGPLICKRINHLPYLHVHACTQPHPRLLRTHTHCDTQTGIQCSFYVTCSDTTQPSAEPDARWDVLSHICKPNGCYMSLKSETLDFFFLIDELFALLAFV